MQSKIDKTAWLAVIVAALGYFVDIYDLILFSIVRIPSLKALGLEGDQLTNQGLLLLNLQMGGMLIGGVLFGILGDKKGRLSVLFGSILLYSLANLLNGFVQNIEQYAVLRLIAGIGLAGELGAGVTLVSEVLPKEKRGLGTTIIATVGISGAILAWFISELFDWRTAYIIGGVLGLSLLLLRVGVLESGLYKNLKQTHIKKGDFFSLFNNKERFIRFLASTCIGIQIWFVVGILLTLSPEFAEALGALSPVDAGKSIMFCYAGLCLGDLSSGLLSQLLKSRKKAAGIFLTLSSISIIVYLTAQGLSSTEFYSLCFLMGVASGYWAIFVTIAAEQFGTNLRATVATSVPNFVRGSLIPISALFAFANGYIGLIHAALLVGTICIALSFWGLLKIKESFSTDLNFYEH